MNISENLKEIKSTLPSDVTLIAVSKTKPVDDIMEAYNAGHRNFGENKIQEMESKWETLPKDIKWHMIGHVQRNKVKYMAPFVSLIHGVDSFKLLKEINKQAIKNNRVIECLLQIKIADEDSKFGMNLADASSLLDSEEYKDLGAIKVVGLMGMATFTDDENQISNEFKSLKNTFNSFKTQFSNDNTDLRILSMGMSGDYKIALKNGSNMIRVGSAIFGERNYN
ncbi:MAG: YggS family pyridoxal phosphate-dependent enzyme [Aequorivita sp.]|nr:YggS family pyridoxal phosphate-dependent enzyme [Aequorivita sp.]|tara:strand:+ start:104483 stop:105154 length:672 start_codon:yes stop_codon:yes gene_type:complete